MKRRLPISALAVLVPVLALPGVQGGEPVIFRGSPDRAGSPRKGGEPAIFCNSPDQGGSPRKDGGSLGGDPAGIDLQSGSVEGVTVAWKSGESKDEAELSPRQIEQLIEFFKIGDGWKSGEPEAERYGGQDTGLVMDGYGSMPIQELEELSGKDRKEAGRTREPSTDQSGERADLEIDAVLEAFARAENFEARRAEIGNPQLDMFKFRFDEDPLSSEGRDNSAPFAVTPDFGSFLNRIQFGDPGSAAASMPGLESSSSLPQHGSGPGRLLDSPRAAAPPFAPPSASPGEGLGSPRLPDVNRIPAIFEPPRRSF